VRLSAGGDLRSLDEWRNKALFGATD